MYPTVLFIISVIAAFIHFFASKKPRSFRRIVELLLAYIIPLVIGIGLLIGFVAHAFYGPQIAALIGWPAHNPFQFEVAMANLALGLLGILCFWQQKGFWFATILASTTYIWGAAGGHIYQMIVHGNHSPYNSGVFLYLGDMAIPLVYFVLGWIYAAQNRFFKKEKR